MKIGDERIVLSTLLTDCADGTDINTGNYDEVYIVIYRPDGTRLDPLVAALVEEPAASGNFFITLDHSTPGSSILDMAGPWEFAGRVRDDTGVHFEAPRRKVFWVV